MKETRSHLERHEQVADALAKGVSISKAMVKGGYCKSRASRGMAGLPKGVLHVLSKRGHDYLKLGLAHGPTTQCENEHPVMGYLRRKMAQGALMAEDAITPGTVATSALTGGARMLGNLPGLAGRGATGATVANKALSGAYGASSLKSGYDAATNDKLPTGQRLAGLSMGLAGGALGAADSGPANPWQRRCRQAQRRLTRSFSTRPASIRRQ